MDKNVNHKLTVEYLKQVFLSTRKTRFGEDVNKEEFDNIYNYLSALFNLTHLQCTVFAIIFNFTNDEDLEQISTQRLMSYLNDDLEFFFDIKPDLELLINRGFIKQKKEDKTDNLFNSYFKINQKLIDMIFQNKVIDFETLYGNGYNFTQFSGHMYRIANRRLVDHLSREDVLRKVEEHENRNQNLLQIQTLKALELGIADRLVMYHLIHKYNERDTSTNVIEVCHNVMSAQNVDLYITNLRENTTPIQHAGLVELKGHSTLELSTKSKKLFINNEIGGSEEDSQTHISTTHYYINHETIPTKQLFFNLKLQSDLNILQALLQKDNFEEYQQEMKTRGTNGGISILLYGPSGTGKSSIVDQLAKQTKRNIFQVDLAQVRSKWYGDSEKLLKNIFVEYQNIIDKQRGETPILLFNECDALLGKRNTNIEDRHDFTETAMTNLLLEFFEKNTGIIIGITNLEQNLDPAFLRRFNFKLQIGNPNKKAIKSIMKNKIEFLEESEINMIAENYSLTGGEIENISNKCVISRIITKSNPTVSEILDFCEEEKLKTNPWKVKF